MILNKRQGLDKPNKIYLVEVTYDKKLTNSKTNDTEYSTTDYIKTENMEMNDLDNIFKNNFINTRLNYIYYRLEDVEFELFSVLKHFKDMQSDLMQFIKAEFEEIHVLNIRRQNMPKHNIFNE